MADKLTPSEVDNAAILAWKSAPEGPHKQLLLSRFLQSKSGLIRQLTAKCARAEKTGESLDDLVQAGTIGFMRALEKFDPAREFMLSTYAAWWVKHEVQKAARRAPVVALPRIRLTNEERSRAVLALRANPEVDPGELGMKRSQLEQVRCSIGVKFISEDTPKGARAIERLETTDAEDVLAEAAAEKERAEALRLALAAVRRTPWITADEIEDRFDVEDGAAVLAYATLLRGKTPMSETTPKKNPRTRARGKAAPSPLDFVLSLPGTREAIEAYGATLAAKRKQLAELSAEVAAAEAALKLLPKRAA